MRHVFTILSFARYVLYRCHEVDYWVRFDVTGIYRENVLKMVEFYMRKHYPGSEYRIVRPKHRPGYADIKFTKVY